MRSRTDLHGCLAGRRQLVVERHHTLEVAAYRVDVDCFARQFFDRSDLRRAGAHHHELADRTTVTRRDKIDGLQSLLDCGQISGRNIAIARDELRQQPVARRRNHENRDRPLAELLRVLLVDIALEVAHQFRGQAALAPLVVVVQRAAIGHQHADPATLDHRVEVAGPRFSCQT